MRPNRAGPSIAVDAALFKKWKSSLPRLGELYIQWMMDTVNLAGGDGSPAMCVFGVSCTQGRE